MTFFLFTHLFIFSSHLAYRVLFKVSVRCIVADYQSTILKREKLCWFVLLSTHLHSRHPSFSLDDKVMKSASCSEHCAESRRCLRGMRLGLWFKNFPWEHYKNLQESLLQLLCSTCETSLLLSHQDILLFWALLSFLRRYAPDGSLYFICFHT